MSTYFGGAVVLVLENGSDLAEWRDRAPAGPDFTRSRHAVTLALHLHIVLDRLHTNARSLAIMSSQMNKLSAIAISIDVTDTCYISQDRGIATSVQTVQNSTV